MVFPDSCHNHLSPMAKHNNTTKTRLITDGFLFLGGVLMALILVCSFWSFFNTNPKIDLSSLIANEQSKTLTDTYVGPNCVNGHNLRHDPPDPTFYDDPEMSYELEKKVSNWDEKRKLWFKHHPSFIAGALERVVVVTGSQSTPCKNPVGDHLLLRAFKNKVDYCRLHGYDIFYSNVLFNPKMHTYWAKLPAVKATMLAHPEAEWIWWVDSDAIFTDMEFKLPLERYKGFDLVIHGWPHLIYEQKSWTSLNAGVFLIRNCQWSMDLINTWSSMGPISPDYEKWGKIQKSIFKDKVFPESDDQSALIYLLYSERAKYETKVYLEGEFYLEGYWLEIAPTFTNISQKYLEIERKSHELRRRHAEKLSDKYAALREKYLKDAGNGRWSWRRPFVTHFTGCQPCSGDHDQMYSDQSCWGAMVKALNFADNQVMRKYGFIHTDLLKTSPVDPVPFDFPDEGPW
ncbi:hypothetical protein ACFE04_022846 [Oxalis oulophora]